MATYYAVTTTNYQQNGYHVVATGSNKDQVQKAGEAALWGECYEDTLYRNLVVMSATKAKKYRVDYGIDY